MESVKVLQVLEDQSESESWKWAKKMKKIWGAQAILEGEGAEAAGEGNS